MGFNQLFDNGEAEARPTMLPGIEIFHPVEAFEDEGEICCGDPFAGVGEGHLDLSRCAFGKRSEWFRRASKYRQVFWRRLLKTWASFSASA